MPGHHCESCCTTQKCEPTTHLIRRLSLYPPIFQTNNNINTSLSPKKEKKYPEQESVFSYLKTNRGCNNTRLLFTFQVNIFLQFTACSHREDVLFRCKATHLKLNHNLTPLHWHLAGCRSCLNLFDQFCTHCCPVASSERKSNTSCSVFFFHLCPLQAMRITAESLKSLHFLCMCFTIQC